MTTAAMPAADVDLFADPVLADPYPAYRMLRHAGPAVYLPGYRVWVLARDREVRHALGHPEVFAAAPQAGLLGGPTVGEAGEEQLGVPTRAWRQRTARVRDVEEDVGMAGLPPRAPADQVATRQLLADAVPGRRVAGVVAELGGSTSHLASLARERGIPMVLGVLDATSRIPDGSQVAVDGVAGVVRWIA